MNLFACVFCVLAVGMERTVLHSQRRIEESQESGKISEVKRLDIEKCFAISTTLFFIPLCPPGSCNYKTASKSQS
jgi:hypothetical protein